MRPRLSIIIPTLDEAASVGETLRAAARAGEGAGAAVEFIVADGGSADRTVDEARAAGARVIAAARGRGAQLRAGARAARGEVLWFLHADTRAPEGAGRAILDALRDPRVAGGNFAVRFDGGTRPARFLTWLYPRLRLLGLCYGDSAIFARREAYERAGGFKPYPIFEDLDLWRALGRRGRLAHLPAEVVTSSRRFEGRGFTRTFARWAFLQLLYWLGVHPDKLGRLYEDRRAVKREG